jgi:hypothetical protein
MPEAWRVVVGSVSRLFLGVGPTHDHPDRAKAAPAGIKAAPPGAKVAQLGGGRGPLRARCKASVGGMGKGEGSKEPDPGAARLGGDGEAKSQKAQPARRRAAAGLRPLLHQRPCGSDQRGQHLQRARRSSGGGAPACRS